LFGGAARSDSVWAPPLASSRSVPLCACTTALAVSSPQAAEDYLPQYTKLPTDREPARAPVAGH